MSIYMFPMETLRYSFVSKKNVADSIALENYGFVDRQMRKSTIIQTSENTNWSTRKSATKRL